MLKAIEKVRINVNCYTPVILCFKSSHYNLKVNNCEYPKAWLFSTYAYTTSEE